MRGVASVRSSGVRIGPNFQIRRSARPGQEPAYVFPSPVRGENFRSPSPGFAGEGLGERGIGSHGSRTIYPNPSPSGRGEKEWPSCASRLNKLTRYQGFSMRATICVASRLTLVCWAVVID